MTPDQLRWQADEKDELADRIQRQARQLPNLLDGVAARMGPDTWRGPAAEGFAASLVRWRSRLDGEADALLCVARRLRHRANELRDEARRIEVAEALALQQQQAALHQAAQRTGAPA